MLSNFKLLQGMSELLANTVCDGQADGQTDGAIT